MKSKIILGSSSLVLGGALLILGSNSSPSQVSADVAVIDQMATARFQIVMFAGLVLVIISFVLFVLAALQAEHKS